MELRVLGQVELRSDSRTVRIRAAKQLGVLGLLTVERGRPLSSDWLIDRLWSTPPRSAKATLQSCVYRLRNALHSVGSSIQLLTRDNAYLLDAPPGALDLDHFEQAAAQGREALEKDRPGEAVAAFRTGLRLWRGEAFEGVELDVVREYAARLRERRLDVIEQCLTAELAAGRHAQTIGELEALTDRHPLRESLWRLRMLALARAGREADALECFRRLQRVLDEDLGLEPSAPVRELHEQILAAGPALEAHTAEARARTATAADIPRMLPPVGDFTGRKEQLARLDQLLPLDPADRPEAVVISAISGTAGIGKTMLALHWAHRVTDRFPDGQLYANLRGFDPSGQPMQAAEAVRGFLTTMGVAADRIPADLAAQVGLYRSLLAGRRVLVVLDNARDSEQVRPLLPGSPGCLAVVTSRNQLTSLVGVEAARPLLLDLLTTGESRELLASRLGSARVDAEPAAVEAIIAACARLPLALAVVAARAVAHPGTPLQVFADELTRTAGLDAFAEGGACVGVAAGADVRTVFSWSYRQLGPPAARLFRLLGLHSGPDISAAAAVSLAGLPPGQVRRSLSELCGLHLLTEHQPGRYTFHDLLRAYARELVQTEPESERLSAIQRSLDHYLHTGNEALRTLDEFRDPMDVDPPRPGVLPEVIKDREALTDWYRTESDVLGESIKLAADLELDRHAWQLGWLFGSYLGRSGRWHDQEITYRIGLGSAQRLGDLATQARAQRGIAAAISRYGRLDEALELYTAALDVATRLGDLNSQARAHHGLSFTCQQQHRLPEALEHAQRARELYRADGDRAGEATTLGEVGWCHALLGNYESAIASCREELALQAELSTPFGEGQTWDTIGYAHHHLGDYAEALSCYQQSLSLSREAGNRYGEAETLDHLGDTYQALDDEENARRHWQQALEILDELGHRDAAAVREKLRRPG